MNYIKHLTGFFDRIIPDRNLNPTHISLYIALFQFWNINRFQNPISITRDEVMRICKISSKATYHKCMKDLNDKGYVKYEPSFNPYKGSMVTLFDFSSYLKPVQNIETSTKKILSKNEQVMNKQGTASETSTGTSIEQALVSSINNTNITNNSNIKNNLNLEEQAKNFQNDNEFLKTDCTEKKEKSSAKKEKKEMPADLLLENSKTSFPTFADYNAKQTENSRQKSSAKKEKKEMLEQLPRENQKIDSLGFADYNAMHTEYRRQKSSAKKEKKEKGENRQKENHPTIDVVKSYFLEQNFPELEANKFFNYFSSIGWLVGGKTPMINWQAAAQNWMLNANKFKSYDKPPDRAKHLSTHNDKDYGEPL